MGNHIDFPKIAETLFRCADCADYLDQSWLKVDAKDPSVALCEECLTLRRLSRVEKRLDAIEAVQPFYCPDCSHMLFSNSTTCPCCGWVKNGRCAHCDCTIKRSLPYRTPAYCARCGKEWGAASSAAVVYWQKVVGTVAST